MTPELLAQQVRNLEITTRRVVTEVFAGEYSSAFKGRGIEFADVREYQPGDDVRTIDWNVTARAGRPFVKRFTEERELTVMLAVDLSASGAFGTTDREKRELAAEVCGVLAFAALKKNDRVGLLAFSDEVELFIPPRKGARHTLRLIRELLAFEPNRTGTSLAAVSDHLARVLHRRSVLFVVSDFQTEQIEHPLGLLTQRHDVVAIDVSDPLESSLDRLGRGIGLVEVTDPETGHRVLLDTSSRRVRNAYRALSHSIRGQLDATLSRLGIDRVSIGTDRDYIHELTKLFKRREHRR
ncbi:MAG: DUF58 domain-containing protein [Phycisphaeraceae bacterium]|nr:DUF58 domain-containing protein [Phycisphaeraceae bacterium]